ncbi:hypothetical protein ACTXT7_002904 [Hymenolepis weldensis]
MDDSDSGLSISMNENAKDSENSPTGSTVIKISVPSVNIEKVYNFLPSDIISDVKISIATDLHLEFRDILNYGLFLPPANGKAGKFLQEDRQLKEYPFTSSVGHLEFKYKQRIYRNLPANVSKLRKINSKANLRHFLSLVRYSDLDKINKLLDKGVDPNFQNRDDGETPLTVAVCLHKPKSIIMALVAGGAHLDYRSADSCTPLHKAAINGNYEAIKVLLDLGQSPNARDAKGLTPLYHCMLNDTSAMCAERLLYDHSILGVTDGAGMEEIHQFDTRIPVGITSDEWKLFEVFSIINMELHCIKFRFWGDCCGGHVVNVCLKTSSTCHQVVYSVTLYASQPINGRPVVTPTSRRTPE